MHGRSTREILVCSSVGDGILARNRRDQEKIGIGLDDEIEGGINGIQCRYPFIKVGLVFGY